MTAATNSQNRQSLNTIELKNLKRVAETMGTEGVRASYSRANMMIASLQAKVDHPNPRLRSVSKGMLINLYSDGQPQLKMAPKSP